MTLGPGPRRSFRCLVSRSSIAALALSASLSVQASDSLPGPERVRLYGQMIERWSIKLAEAKGTVVFGNGSRAEFEGGAVGHAGTHPVRLGPGVGRAIRLVLDCLSPPRCGRSKPTDRAREGRQLAADLRGLLQQQGLEPPGVLVPEGPSGGGGAGH